MDNNFDIEVVAEVEIDVENEVDIEVEIEQAGPQGKDGLSAYDIYVKNGGILTEEEWLISLKGEPGKDGNRGEKGEKGDKGDIGDTGYTLRNTVRGESITVEDAVECKLFNLEIDGKSVQNGEPTPDTPVEIKSVGYTNLFDATRFLSDTGIDSNGTIVSLEQNDLYYMPVEYGKKYIMTFDNTTTSGNMLYGFCDTLPTIGSQCSYNILTIDNLNNHIFTPEKSSNKYICLRLNYYNQIPYMSNISFMEGENAQPYIPNGKYKIVVKTTNGTDTNTTILELNEPLRSLPNGVKDIAYIKNNKLYVDRCVGSVILNGTQNISVVNGKTYNLFCFDLENLLVKNVGWELSGLLSNKGEERKRNDLWNHNNEGFSYGATDSTSYKDLVFYSEETKEMTVEEFKTWLSSNNIQIDYKLATPTTEEVGDCLIYTYEGVNNIDLEADLRTEFSVTYAQDMRSILKDYPSMEEVKEYVDSQLGTINEQLASLTEVK